MSRIGSDVPILRLDDALGLARKRAVLGGLVLAHLLLVALLWQGRSVERHRERLTPLQVSVLPAERAPVPPAPPARLPLPELARALAPAVQMLPVPQITVNEAPSQMPVAAAVPLRPATVEPAPVSAAAPPEQAAPRPSRPLLPPSAVRYLVEPRLQVPLLSRRLGEQGVVHLRLVIDAQGRLVEATLKQSSGYSRLDQQALLDIRSARFAPYVDQGRPVDWETTALLSYELGR